MADLLEARDFDYVVGSVHFLARRRRRHGRLQHLGHPALRRGVWRRYFETLARGRARAGSSTSSPTPTSSRSGARDGGRTPGRRPAPLLRARGRRRSPSRGRRRGLHRRPAQADRRALPGAGVPGDVPGGRRARGALQRRPPPAGRRRRTTSRRSSCSTELGVRELCVFERRRAAASRSARSCSSAVRRVTLLAASAMTRHRLLARAPAGARRGRDPAASSASTATPTPTCSTHAVIDALLGAAGLGDIGQHFPDTDERWRDADSIALLAGRRRDARASAGLRIVNVDCTVVIERPSWRPTASDPRAPGRGAGVDDGARERQGDDRRAGSASSGAARASRRWRREACRTTERLPAAIALRAMSGDPAPRHAAPASLQPLRPRDARPRRHLRLRADRLLRASTSATRGRSSSSACSRASSSTGLRRHARLNVTDVNDKIYAPLARRAPERRLAARDDRPLRRRHRRARPRPPRPRAAGQRDDRRDHRAHRRR